MQLDQQQNVYLVKQLVQEKPNQSLTNSQTNSQSLSSKDEYVNKTLIQETFRQPLTDLNDENRLNQTKPTNCSIPSANVKVYSKLFNFLKFIRQR